MGAFLNDEMQKQLESVFSKLTRDVTIVTIAEPDNPKCQELEEAVKSIAAISSRIKTQCIQKGEAPELEAKIHTTRFPAAALLDEEGNYSGVIFHGVPGGQEINSFVLSVYNLGSEGQKLPGRLKKKIQAIEKPVNIKVGVSLACHYCPAVVTAAQQMAILNPNIEAEMIDATLYSDLVEKYKIQNVPAIIINDDKVHFGAKTLEELYDYVKECTK